MSFQPRNPEAGPARATARRTTAAGAWEVDLRSGRGVYCDAILQLVGPLSADSPPHADLLSLERVHPDDRGVLEAVLERAVATHSSEVEDVEFRLQAADGAWIWLHCQTRILDWFDDGRPARLAGWHTDITARKRLEQAMEAVLQNVERLTGEDFCRSLALQLVAALNVRFCLIGRLLANRSIRTLAFCERGSLAANFEFPLSGTPCEFAFGGQVCLFPEGVAERFPADRWLAEHNVQGYLGLGLTSASGEPIGIISVMDDRPLTQTPVVTTFLRLFAVRAAVEIERLSVEESRQSSDQQYRQLFGQMISAFALLEPVYDKSGFINDFRYVEVNPAFERMTGLPASLVPGRTIREMIPLVEEHWIATMRGVALTGEPASLDAYSQDYDRYYELRAFQPAPGRVAILFNDVTDRQLVENRLRESERTLRELFENTQLAVVVRDLQGAVTFANESALQLLGRPAREVIGRDFLGEFVPIAEYRQILDVLASVGGDWALFPRHWRNHIIHAGGTQRLVEWDISPVYDADGRLVSIASLGRDLTAWAELEAQYRQAQKMEAVGRLAGGIAHDFNNLLMVITGYAGLALARLAEDHPARKPLNEIQKAGDRAAGLTRQLLAFSRKQIFQVRTVSLNDVVSDAVNMLSRLIDARIKVEAHLDADPGLVRSDPGQLLQVVMNLGVNARDAIRGQGHIRFRTFMHTVPVDGDPALPALSPGNYVAISVQDDGEGMDEEVQRHVFEPFFTTKKAGRGTGLGLATVYGIVRQSRGAIKLESKPGHGTTFLILFPAAETQGAQRTSPRLPQDVQAAGGRCILLVEDQDSVREFLRAILEDQGYRVVLAADGSKAMSLIDEGLRPDVLLTDVVMPGFGGVALATKARSALPGLKVILMSGYANSRERGVSDAFLQKPFTASGLLRAVESILR